MNRSFFIILLPAVAVGVGYLLVFHWRGFTLNPYPFVGAAAVIAAAVYLVHRHQRRKAPRGSR